MRKRLLNDRPPHDKNAFVSAIKQTDKECGNCGCELDPLDIICVAEALYKRERRNHPIMV